MLIVGLTPQHLQELVYEFNTQFDATVIIVDVQDKGSSRRNATRCRFVPSDTRGKYGRLSHSGRRIKALCWHGQRDLFRFIFEATDSDYDVSIRTARARYDGLADFEETFPPTGNANIGSIMEPLAYHDACDCH